jgi:hypothetical protein
VLEQIERKQIRGRVISIPAIAEADDPLGREPGELLWRTTSNRSRHQGQQDRRRQRRAERAGLAMILGVVGFLGISEKDVAVPFNAIKLTEKTPLFP